MYERSAIVLEKYFNNICGFDKKVNLKTIYRNYKNLIEEVKNYQTILEDEDKIINEFEDVANEIRKIQQEQKKIYKSNIKLEEDRNQLFDSLDEDASSIEKKLIKMEERINGNNKRLEELRKDFINASIKFNEKQKERNKYSRSRRETEANYYQIVEKSKRDIVQIDVDLIEYLKEFISSEGKVEKDEIIDIMIGNGKDERVPFNSNVIEDAVNVRNIIAQKEIECYILIYDRTKKILAETGNDDVKLDKYNKVLRDVSIKLAFLKAEKMYIVSFLDNERMTAINGLKFHEQLMIDACEKFKLDIEQFDNLYQLVLKEISGKATKKAYNELYNKEYLKNIEEKERNFEQEINSIKIKTGTIIDSNYWRINEIKNIYEVFQKEVSEKFEKDLSEFKLEEPEEIVNIVEKKKEIEEDDIFKKEISDDVEYIEEYEYYEDDDDEYDDEDEDIEYEYNDEYDDEDGEYEDENSEYEDDDEYDDEDEDSEYEDDDEYDGENEDSEYEDDDEYDGENEDEYDDEEEDSEYEDDDEYDDEDEDNEYEDDDDEEEYDIYKINIKENEEENRKGKGIFNRFFKDKKE